MAFFDPVNPHAEAHRGTSAGWLRAAVLGANDGLVSTASLMVGVAASGAATGLITTAGLAGLPERWPWQPANTCQSARKSTSKEPTGAYGAARPIDRITAGSFG